MAKPETIKHVIKLPRPLKIWNDLLAPNVVEHIKLMQTGERATDWHFRVRSKFAKALQAHIVGASDKTCIIDKGGRAVSCHRGTGYAVNVKDVCVHFAMPGEVEYMSFKVSVGLEPLEDDVEYEGREFRDHNTEHRFSCPTDLELDFTQAKFDLWVRKTKEEVDAERLSKERKQLDFLLKRHPKYAAEKLLKTKPSA